MHEIILHTTAFSELLTRLMIPAASQVHHFSLTDIGYVRLEFFFICQHSASWIQIWWVLSLCILCFFLNYADEFFLYKLTNILQPCANNIWLLKLICVCIVFIMFHVSHKTTILFYSSSQCLQLHIDNLIISIFLFLQISWSIFFIEYCLSRD